MHDKYENLAIITAILLLFMTMLSGCIASREAGPAENGPIVEGAPAAPQEPATVPSTTGAYPQETQPAQPSEEPATPPSTGPATEPESQPAEETTPAEPSTPAEEPPSTEGPDRLGVALPGDPDLDHARFIVSIPQNTPVDSKVYLEAYDSTYRTWKAYEMESNNSILGWNVVIELDSSGGVDNSDNTFKYRYSRTGEYATAEKMAFESANAYRTRPIPEVAGKFVQDEVKEWRG